MPRKGSMRHTKEASLVKHHHCLTTSAPRLRSDGDAGQHQPQKASSNKSPRWNQPSKTSSFSRHIIAATPSARLLMRTVSGLGMEDPVYGTVELVSHQQASSLHPSQKIFDDMSIGDVPADMQDLITVASDPTADLDKGQGMDVAVFHTCLQDLCGSVSNYSRMELTFSAKHLSALAEAADGGAQGGLTLDDVLRGKTVNGGPGQRVEAPPKRAVRRGSIYNNNTREGPPKYAVRRGSFVPQMRETASGYRDIAVCSQPHAEAKHEDDEGDEESSLDFPSLNKSRLTRVGVDRMRQKGALPARHPERKESDPVQVAELCIPSTPRRAGPDQPPKMAQRVESAPRLVSKLNSKASLESRPSYKSFYSQESCSPVRERPEEPPEDASPLETNRLPTALEEPRADLAPRMAFRNATFEEKDDTSDISPSPDVKERFEQDLLDRTSRSRSLNKSLVGIFNPHSLQRDPFNETGSLVELPAAVPDDGLEALTESMPELFLSQPMTESGAEVKAGTEKEPSSAKVSSRRSLATEISLNRQNISLLRRQNPRRAPGLVNVTSSGGDLACLADTPQKVLALPPIGNNDPSDRRLLPSVAAVFRQSEAACRDLQCDVIKDIAFTPGDPVTQSKGSTSEDSNIVEATGLRPRPRRYRRSAAGTPREKLDPHDARASADAAPTNPRNRMMRTLSSFSTAAEEAESTVVMNDMSVSADDVSNPTCTSLLSSDNLADPSCRSVESSVAMPLQRWDNLNTTRHSQLEGTPSSRINRRRNSNLSTDSTVSMPVQRWDELNLTRHSDLNGVSLSLHRTTHHTTLTRQTESTIHLRSYTDHTTDSFGDNSTWITEESTFSKSGAGDDTRPTPPVKQEQALPSDDAMDRATS